MAHRRIPGRGTCVCLGNEIRTDADDELVVDTSGCVMVDEAPPASLTIEAHHGGLAVSD